MSNSIIGHHSYTMAKSMTVKSGDSSYENYYSYGKKTGRIRIRPDKRNVDISKIEDAFLKQLYSGTPKRYLIEYRNKNKGIKWTLRLNNKSPAYMRNPFCEDKPCSVKAKINTKLLAGITDYTAASNEENIKTIESLFNEEAEKISPLLGKFNSYSLNRIDYCLNADVRELDIGCTADQMMKLIKRAYTAHFEEL